MSARVRWQKSHGDAQYTIRAIETWPRSSGTFWKIEAYLTYYGKNKYISIRNEKKVISVMRYEPSFSCGYKVDNLFDELPKYVQRKAYALGKEVYDW